ncbi:chaperone NapD [Ferrimonas aestuarii]|uniref:chaperone NapD n=1 Tax=Ferrimonas aestuarii TaxID=2569539 RepID=UPI00145DB947|nr:chaperone NapD [Ferrimonas aestuarii]
MSQPTHISGLVISCHIEATADVANAVSAFDGCEIVSQTETGKLVATLECADQKATQETINQINDLDGVVNTALAYHRVEQL